MIINFPQPPKWLTFERLALWLIILLLAIWILRSCGDRNTWQQKLADKEAQRKRDVDSVQGRFAAYHNSAMDAIQYWQDSAESLLAEVTVLRYERDQAWVGLEKNKIAADKLIANIKNSQGKDSADCLELANKYTEAAGQVIIYKNKSDNLIKRLDTAGSYKDKIITRLGSLVNEAVATQDYVKKQYDTLYQSFGKLKPRNSWWIGMDATVAPNVLMAGPQISFETKKGARYTLAGGLDSKNVRYYVRGELAWKISFRK